MSKIFARVAEISVFCAFFLSVSATVREDGFARGYYRQENAMVLSGHVISRHHVTMALDCSLLCIASSQCLSCNYKPGSNVCELNNFTRKMNSSDYLPDSQSLHFYDYEIENSFSCLDYLRNGARKDGIYIITGSNSKHFNVWCDMTSEPGSAWTLIFSYAYRHRYANEFCTVLFSQSATVFNDSPNWEKYRLSLNRMKTIASQSTHIRVTSSYPVYGVDYQDYLRAKLSSLDILTLDGNGICTMVEYVNIRGFKGKDLTIPFWQSKSRSMIFHSDSSSTKCQFDASSGAVSSENNFGALCHTGNTNTAFRASENDDSTTQYWFGGYL